MTSLNQIYTILIVLPIFFFSNASIAQNQVKEKPWSATLNDGTIINKKELYKILHDHEKWLETDGKEGVKAILIRADLQKANLQMANLQEAYLEVADLQNADLRNANLQKANLWKTNLQQAYLGEANLIEAYLENANLQEATLVKAYLQKANLDNANLQKANLTEANLQKASLVKANLQKADLAEANLQKAYLVAANLQEAELVGANLQKADLAGANLQEVTITEADLGGCFLDEVNKLPFNYYEPKPGSTPYIPSIAGAQWLKDLTYDKRIHGLLDLREGFKKLGYREQENKITYAIRHTKTLQLFGKTKINQDKKKYSKEEPKKTNASIFNLIEGYTTLIFLEWTCEWGMSPGRPFFILISLILPFSLIYMLSLVLKNKKDGIWKHWIKERSRTDLGSDKPELLTYKLKNSIFNGIYFSVLSAFHIGWRDLNVGNWIARIQPREYSLRASGWVRVVSGVQSLISVYLLALSILTYFGRPYAPKRRLVATGTTVSG